MLGSEMQHNKFKAIIFRSYAPIQFGIKFIYLIYCMVGDK